VLLPAVCDAGAQAGHRLIFPFREYRAKGPAGQACRLDLGTRTACGAGQACRLDLGIPDNLRRRSSRAYGPRHPDRLHAWADRVFHPCDV